MQKWFRCVYIINLVLTGVLCAFLIRQTNWDKMNAWIEFNVVYGYWNAAFSWFLMITCLSCNLIGLICLHKSRKRV